MRSNSILTKGVFVGIVIGGIGGLVLALGAEEMDRQTTTDEFCTSCHAMAAYIASSEVYKASAHQTTASGVRPGCASCHIPKGLVPATFTHVVNGVGDLWGEFNYDYDDPETWQAVRIPMKAATDSG